MTHGPTYYDSKGICIYCGAKDIDLTNEHIVPYSLGGAHVLRNASCRNCANFTKKFEQRIARDLWGDARTAFGAPTRRKRARKSHIVITDPNDRSNRLTVPAGEYPAGLVFYKMCQAGLLQGMPETIDLSNSWQLVVIDDDKRRQNFVEKYRREPVIKFRHVPDAFGRLLAKIGYGQVLTSLDPGDFRPICLPYITGDKGNLSYVVGGTLEDQLPETEHGYSLSTIAFGSARRLMLIALIRLYANTHAPAYHVVVGDVTGTKEVERITQKLDAAADGVTQLRHLVPGSSAHWLPSKLPLPFWTSDPPLQD